CIKEAVGCSGSSSDRRVAVGSQFLDRQRTSSVDRNRALTTDGEERCIYNRTRASLQDAAGTGQAEGLTGTGSTLHSDTSLQRIADVDDALGCRSIDCQV